MHDVTLHEDRLSARILDQLDSLVAAGDVPRGRHNYLGALPGEELGTYSPNACSPTGDEGHLAVERPSHLLLHM